MPLTKDDWKWLVACSGGTIAFPASRGGELGKAEALTLELEQKLAKQGAEERALKDSLLATALTALEETREPMRDTAKFDTKVKGKLLTKTVKTGGDVAQRDAWDPRQDGPKTVSVSDKGTRDQIARQPAKPGSDPAEPAPTKVKAGKSQKGQLADLMAAVIAKSDELAAVSTQRWYLDEAAGKLLTRTEPLFDNDEITKELWTPLTREKIIGDNFIPHRFSQTQKMLDGSNAHYISECKEKGEAIGYDLTTFAKGTVDLARDVTTAVLGAAGPASGMSADQVAMATQMTIGVSALLTTGMQVFSQAEDALKAGTFSLSDFRTTFNGIALGVGRIVASATGDDTLGLAISDAVAGAMTAVDVGSQVAAWVKDARNGDFDWSRLSTDLGAAMARGIGGVASSTLAAASDRTSGDVSTDLAHASKAAEKAFAVAAKAMEADAVKLIRNGQWKQVVVLLAQAGGEAAATLPNILKYDEEYSAATTLSDQTKSTKTAGRVNDGVALAQDGLEKGLDLLAEKSGELGKERRNKSGKAASGPTNKHRLRDEEIEAAFDKRKKAMDQKVYETELGELAAQQQKEREDYRDMLNSMGSKGGEADQKTIAKLIADIERDRAIWTVITSIAAGGAAVAAVFVPALGGVAEIAKFAANIKAAADRLSAMLDWMSARKDAKSAVSPYATAFENMFTNQRAQLAHYSVQAAANAIKALLAAGELSPYAPAFKVAGAAVGTAASAEALIFKTYNRVALVKSWKTTQKALADPKNRKLGLIARELNPTLAKYTIAYGAMIEKDEVAIRAMGAIGLDRETLTRAGDKVADVKNYMQKLYVDDNVVLGRLDSTQASVKVPEAELTPQAWSTSVMLWQRADGVVGKPPAQIINGLTLLSKFGDRKPEDLAASEMAVFQRTLRQLVGAFGACRPDAVGTSTAEGAQFYKDLAFAKLEVLGLMASPEMAPAAAN